MATGPLEASGGYLSDDLDAQLRSAAPRACQDCRHLWVKRSWVTASVLTGCDLAQEQATNGHLVSYLMLQAAVQGCAFQELMAGELPS